VQPFLHKNAEAIILNEFATALVKGTGEVVSVFF
jgi:hypothetical protein